MDENMTAAAEAATNGNEFEGWQDAGFDGAEEQAAETQATEEQAAQETSAQPEEGSNTAAEENGACSRRPAMQRMKKRSKMPRSF